MTMKERQKALMASLDRLASLYEMGALSLATVPHTLIHQVCDEIVALRAEVERLRAVAAEVPHDP
jgi:hypothetical protein